MIKTTPTVITATLAALFGSFGAMPAHADATSPHLAAYYNVRMLICGRTAYQWRADEPPHAVAENATQVGVGRDASYVLTASGRLLALTDTSNDKREILDRVAWFAAGRTGLFAARTDGSLVYLARPKSWFGESEIARPERLGNGIVSASVGDSADYIVKIDGSLHVRGLAHRGQFGDGGLEPSEGFTPVARDVVAVKSHTGHAIMLKRNGTVMGTGGNIFGPLGRHGIGDKAIKWGEIFRDAAAIATGSSHSLAIDRAGSLWQWGRDIGLDPQMVLDDVAAAAADRSGSVALRKNGSVWQWDRGERPKLHLRCP